MRISLAQLNVQAGNFELNTSKIISAIREAKANHSDLVVFSELVICGYPARDFLTYLDFILQCEKQIQEILPETMGIGILIGCPARNPVPSGKDLFNTAWFLADGKVVQQIHKTLLPTYDVFDEYRYFEPNKTFSCIEWKGSRIAVTICEDIWDIDEVNPLYNQRPLDFLMHELPDLIINLSASPFHAGQYEKRMNVLRKNVEKYRLPLVYVNQVGAQTELIFDGGSCILNAQADLCLQLPFFKECQFAIDLQSISPMKTVCLSREEIVLNALVMGVKDYFSKLGFQKAILGLSGGIDSALVLAIACEALGPQNVLPVLLPSRYSSSHSVSDSVSLCKNLGCAFKKISIEEPFQSFLQTLQPEFNELPHDITEENIQARIRGVILMALSNKFGYILLNTTNKSEAAVGYGTLYGDMCGGLSVIGDVYKSEVYQLCQHINREKEIIPESILSKPPSAELRPNQKDADSLPDYGILDKILFMYIELCESPDGIISAGYDATLVHRILRMVNMNEWKRYQAPPILRVSPKAFGMGRRMPIEGRYLF